MAISELEPVPMNRIVKERYPAANLPDDLREGIDPRGTVTVTVVTEPREGGQLRAKAELFGIAKERNTSIREAVARIRSLRDEWD